MMAGYLLAAFTVAFGAFCGWYGIAHDASVTAGVGGLCIVAGFSLAMEVRRGA